MRRNCCIIGVWVEAGLFWDCGDDRVDKLNILSCEPWPEHSPSASDADLGFYGRTERTAKVVSKIGKSAKNSGILVLYTV